MIDVIISIMALSLSAYIVFSLFLDDVSDTIARQINKEIHEHSKKGNIDEKIK